MNTDEAKEYLKSISKPEFYSYIDTRIAGDFAVSIALKMSMMSDALRKQNKSEKWFLNDPELDGFQIYGSEKEARSALKNNFDFWKDSALDDGEWPDYVEGITIGLVKEISYLKVVRENDVECATLEMTAI